MAEVFVVVTDEGLYIGNGLVNRWFKRMNNSLYHNIVRHAPIRSGELKAGIELDYNQDPISLRILSGEVVSTAPHTKYVIEGTAGQGADYIYSRGGWASHDRVERLIAQRARGIPFMGAATKGLWLGMNRAYPGKPQLRVHGQRANNFLLEGYNATARTHRSLHPIFPGFVTR